MGNKCMLFMRCSDVWAVNVCGPEGISHPKLTRLEMRSIAGISIALLIYFTCNVEGLQFATNHKEPSKSQLLATNAFGIQSIVEVIFQRSRIHQDLTSICHFASYLSTVISHLGEISSLWFQAKQSHL